MPKIRKSLSEFLIENNIVNSSQVQTGQLEAKKTGEELAHVLVRLGLISEDKLLSYYTEYCKIPRADMKILDHNVVAKIPEKTARRYHLIALSLKDKKLTVAMANPLNLMILDEIRFRANAEIVVQVAPDSEINRAINQHYASEKTSGAAVGEIIKKIDVKTISKGTTEVEPKNLRSMAEEAPVIKLLDTFITQAFQNRASDLHIEPDENIVRVRHRIDGVLYDIATLPKYLQSAVISRAKIMADLNIAQKRAPQDGRFQIDIEGSPIDVRVSTFPTIYGENVVMRLLDVHSILIGLDELGFTKADLEKFRIMIKNPYGIILVTGPTGSGKTTSLYSALNTLNSPKKNIMTIEDPVEYHLFGIRQAQVNPQAGMTFASGLRSILRQDPDIIMVGEIRDLETAQIAVHSALTGHLVLSTLHTNDAASALTRLVDMGVEPFLIASSVIGVMAQRLVRLICPVCKAPQQPNPELLKQIPDLKNKTKFFYGKGCNACKGIGFKGRIATFELLTMNDKIKDLVLAKSASNEIKKAAIEGGMKTMWENGLDKVNAGITTIEEVMAVATMS